MPGNRSRASTAARLRDLHHRLVRSFWFKLASVTGVVLAVHTLVMGGLALMPRAGPPLDLLGASAVAPAAAASCGWTEPPRTYPEGVRWSCSAVDWADGDTLTARCDGQPGTVVVRLRGVDTDERGEARWWQAREELRRRTAGHALAVAPRHHSHRRVVADVVAGGVDVGRAMDAAGWSKADCPKR